jgi:hypothetical protein
MAISHTDGVEILDPTLRVTDVMAPAPRLASLNGKILGLLDNSKEKADVFLSTLGARLREQFKIEMVLMRRKPTYSRVATPAIIAELSESCDCVITAMGA